MSILESVNTETIVKGFFILVPSYNLKAITWDKEKDLRKHFIQNLDFAMFSKNCFWFSNLALTTPAKMNS